MQPATNPSLWRFSAGANGPWIIEGTRAVTGPSIEHAERLHIASHKDPAPPAPAWTLQGVTSNLRYTNAHERDQLARLQAPIGRPEATCAALIPIRKNARWWDMPQDQRRAIFEEQSRHIERSIPYLPRIARRLHHSRDLGEPFDFLTWFEFAPEHAPAFDELTAALRATREWEFVDREVEIRLKLDPLARIARHAGAGE